MVRPWWRYGGSLIEMWWLLYGDVVAHWWRCDSSLMKLWWLLYGDMVASWWRCGGSLEMWWLLYREKVATLRRFGGFLMEMWWLLIGDQGWEFAHSLIAHSLICSFRTNQMSDCEQITQVAQRKWATVSELLRSYKTNERPWVIRSGHSEEMSKWAICSKHFG